MADKLFCGLLLFCLCFVIVLCRPEGPRIRSHLKDQSFDQDGSELLDFGSRKSYHPRSSEDLMDNSSDEDGVMDSRGAIRYGGAKRGFFRYGYDKRGVFRYG